MQSLGIEKQSKMMIFELVTLDLISPPHYQGPGFQVVDFQVADFVVPGLKTQIRRPRLLAPGLGRLRFVSVSLSVQARLRSFLPYPIASLSWNFAFQCLPHLSSD